MAGIGVKLNRIYNKKSLLAYLAGFAYSAVTTIAPMVIAMVQIFVMEKLLDYEKLNYTARELFACTVLYIFVFSLLTASPFNAILSRYMSDVIYEERYDDIMPCFYTGLLINMALSCGVSIPFYIREYLVGGVDAFFVFLSFIGFISLVFVFYSMLYLSICKDYVKITLFYFIGVIFGILLSLLLVRVLGMDTLTGMLLSVDATFLLIACLEFGQLRSYFRENSRNYRKVLPYFRKYWPLIFSNLMYTLSLYVHNFVFWTTDMRLVVANTYICAEPYDMATFLGLITNVSSSMIFISGVEMRFHDKYKHYSESVIGGRLVDIESAKKQMFRQLSGELMNLARVQFTISTVLFLLFIVILPMYGFSGLVMQIYPALAVGYFILFLMYGELIFLYYYNDLTGAVLTSAIMLFVTFGVAIFATRLDPIWYGIGLCVGGAAAWTFGYFRLRWVERNLDRHIFCNGTLLKRGRGKRPSSRVYLKRGV